MSLEKTIFKNGSTTYYISSKFFPKDVRQDVFKLYSFVRVADDYVDVLPVNKKAFKILTGLWAESFEDKKFDTVHHKDDSLNLRVVKNIVYLARKYEFDPNWINAFLASMQADLDKKTYLSLDGALWYVYGSAEVIGLMMAKIMQLPEAAMPYAALQGRAMQWINFIRDVEEDNQLGRCYFPQEDLKQFGLAGLSQKTALESPKEFQNFMQFQLNRYREWQHEAQKGFSYIPRRLRLPLATAVDNFNWVARKITINPGLVYQKKIQPSKPRVVITGIKRATWSN